MTALATFMGLFWLLAEGLIMVCVRRGLLFLETGRTRQRGFMAACLALFGVVVFLYAGKGLILERLPSWPAPALYNGCLWNFICTLWVLIEGAIAVYVFKAYRLLRSPQTRKAFSGRRAAGLIVWVSAALLLAGFAYYHATLYLFLLPGRSALPHGAMANILRFYIKICGLFWILIEWVVAVLAVKAYRLLKEARHAP